MANYPTLSKLPNIAGFTKELTSNPTISSTFENGMELTRNRYTAVSKKWALKYSFLTDNDKYLLEEFEKTVAYRSGSFKWTNPSNNIEYEVRFAVSLKFVRENTIDEMWSISISINEIRPNSEEDIS